MPFVPELAGPHDPLATTPPLEPGWIRRTTSIDTTRPKGFDGDATVDARGRDLSLTQAREPSVVGRASLRGRVDPGRELVALAATTHGDPDAPDDAQLGSLVGARVAGGFRAAAVAALPELARSGSVWFLLVDDLVGAMLVSGYAIQHAEALAGGGPMADGARAHPDLILAQADICAGWAADGLMLRSFRATGDLPAPQGPPAPALQRPEDPLGWHEMDSLPPHSTRRVRRIDLGPPDLDGVACFDVHFRDSHTDGDGLERSVHEYTLAGSLDMGADTVTAVRAEARVLPWQECPAALASAQRVLGVPLGDLRDFVRTELRGLPTCTHLNDTLRSLADLDRLLVEAHLAHPPM